MWHRKAFTGTGVATRDMASGVEPWRVGEGDPPTEYGISDVGPTTARQD